MKKILLYCLILSVSWGVNAGELKRITPCPSAEAKIKCIKEGYVQLQTDESNENLKAYFECFPDSFDEFHQIFGYEDKGYEMRFALLAEESHKYVFLFEKTASAVPERQYYEKLINMASGGSWEADGVTALQLIIKSAFKKDFSDFQEVLSGRDESEIQSFWRFYFDGPHGIKLDESICSGAAVNGKACKVLSELVRATVPEVDEIH